LGFSLLDSHWGEKASQVWFSTVIKVLPLSLGLLPNLFRVSLVISRMAQAMKIGKAGLLLGMDQGPSGAMKGCGPQAHEAAITCIEVNLSVTHRI
jgi:hypothetical protein